MRESVLVVVVSDTHAPRRWQSCPPAVAEHLRVADVILHAGDVCTPDVLDELAEYAPVHVVRGNNDGLDVAAWPAPDMTEVTLAGVRIGMVHDAGPAEGRARRMRQWFPDADLVVFGHSHIPLSTIPGFAAGSGVDAADDPSVVALFNPGSPTDRRRQPQGTVGTLDLRNGRLVDVRIIPVT